MSLISKMFSLAVRWEMRDENPAKGIERNNEEKRNRYLVGDELRRLIDALAAYPVQTSANAIRLLLLTGARRGEVLAARSDQFDLETGVWVKPSSHTKQKREHRIPLSAGARLLLVEIKVSAGASEYLFPSAQGAAGHLTVSRGLGLRSASWRGLQASARTIYGIPMRQCWQARGCRFR